MKYIIEENLKKLILLLKHYEKTPYTHKNTDTDDAEKLWNASLFFANLLLASDSTSPDISEEELKTFTSEYEKQHAETVELKSLFSKFWLRRVFGNVYVPSVVQKTAREFEDKKGKHNELLFIRYLTVELKIDQTTPTHLNELIKSYQSTHELMLNKDWLQKFHFLKAEKENSVVKINGIDYYSKLLDNWETFKFINDFLKYKQNKYYRIKSINRTRFNQIYKEHKSVFPKTPTVKNLIENKVLAETPEVYNLSIRSGSPNYILELADKIKATIWHKILENASFENDGKRVLKFLSYSKFDEQRHDICPHLSEEAKTRLREAALEMVLNEPDLVSVDQEFDKVYLDDGIHAHHNWNHAFKIKNDDLERTDDIYELYDKMLQVSDSYNGNLFYEQNCRADLSYLVDILLLLDKEHSRVKSADDFKYPHYPVTKKILLEGLSKPYLLWKTAYFLKTKEQTRLPFFLIEEKFSALTFRLLDNTTIEALPDETVSQVRTKMLKIAIQLILDEITSSNNFDKPRFTNIVFQIFKEVNRDKFQPIRNSRTIELYEAAIADKKERESSLLGTIENYTLKVNSYPKKANISEISKHLSSLLAKVSSYLPKRELSNGNWQLPLHKLGYLSWLSKVAINCQFKKKTLESNIEQEIAETFLSAYLTAIEKITITKKNFSNSESMEIIPSWYLDNENLDNIDWISPFILLQRNNKFSKFLSPLILFNLEEDIYNDLNKYSVKRLRSHLFILLSTLNLIYEQNSSLFRLQKETKGIKKKLEATILDILKKNAVQHTKNKVDILDEFFERSFNNSKKNELIPQIANSINWFSDKKGIIDVLTKTSDLIRLLIIVDWITAEGLRKELIKKIKKSKITEFLKSSRFNPEIELLITKLTFHPKLAKQTREALEYWTKNVTSHNIKNLEKATYLFALIVAYNDKDEMALNAIKIPENKSYKVHKEFEIYDYKLFFRGLIRFESNPESAYQIFDSLHHQYPKHSTIALNRFAAKVNWASKKEENALFEEALFEWQQMNPDLPETYVENIKENVWTNQLTAYYHLNNKEEFDKLYLSIPFPYQMKEDIVELKVVMLVKHQLRADAKKVVFKATNYHKDSSGRIPKFIRRLKAKLDDETDIRFLQNNFNEIFASEPKTLIKIFPDRLNAENSLGSFITKEVTLASSKMLEKINSVQDIGLEDKYNDLVQLALDARVAQWGWQVKDQARGGFSANQNKYNPGERDILICNSNSEPLVVCEAFIWKDRRTAENHINKIFNYYHKRNDFIILIYDRNENKNFDKNWDKYVNDTLPSLSYLPGFDLKKTEWKELTNKFGYKSSAIKVGSTRHGKTTTIFHIMVNLNYRVK